MKFSPVPPLLPVRYPGAIGAVRRLPVPTYVPAIAGGRRGLPSVVATVDYPGGLCSRRRSASPRATGHHRRGQFPRLGPKAVPPKARNATRRPARSRLSPVSRGAVPSSGPYKENRTIPRTGVNPDGPKPCARRTETGTNIRALGARES